VTVSTVLLVVIVVLLGQPEREIETRKPAPLGLV
jgi:hypothetical protein